MPPILLRLLQLSTRALALLPLPLVHAIGAVLGWLLYLGSPKLSRRMRKNLQQSGLCPDPATFRRTLRRTIREFGKGLLETFAIWQRDEQAVVGWVRERRGWEQVEQALGEGKGIIFLTPHLGCFEITSLYYAARHPITVLYRPPKKSWLMPLIQAGRERGLVRLAPATTQGVRSLLQALKKGEAIGILPDQTPAEGEGEWAPYFGRQAYTMTLASRLAEKTGAAVIMAFGERLPRGRGYCLHLTRLPDGAIDTVAGLNAAVETQVRQCPEQYLWNYRRYKIRGKLPPPDAPAPSAAETM